MSYCVMLSYFVNSVRKLLEKWKICLTTLRAKWQHDFIKYEMIKINSGSIYFILFFSLPPFLSFSYEVAMIVRVKNFHLLRTYQKNFWLKLTIKMHTAKMYVWCRWWCSQFFREEFWTEIFEAVCDFLQNRDLKKRSF